eukprot:TRINITY_DN10467_c0_g1_i2.p1 TRINITY_DN10467_c0_g1~~TRINITY_DN10467_c0_g1_i2.p1  ORF type:complete len:176 (+),score=6.22 TRINITY_DN10467_c0_g1_i2:66-530(+)
MARRLGGGSVPLDREGRLEKLLASSAFGCAVPAQDGAPSCQARAASAPRPSTSGRARPPKSGPNIHTIASTPGCSASGSRLHQTTEAYRQQRGTTARTVEEVGRASMTAEKAAEVDRARAKVRGDAGQCRPRSASGRPPLRPCPHSRGQRLGVR